LSFAAILDVLVFVDETGWKEFARNTKEVLKIIGLAKELAVREVVYQRMKGVMYEKEMFLCNFPEVSTMLGFGLD
jgi:hypothetical protein